MHIYTFSHTYICRTKLFLLSRNVCILSVALHALHMSYCLLNIVYIQSSIHDWYVYIDLHKQLHVLDSSIRKQREYPSNFVYVGWNLLSMTYLSVN